MGYTKFNRKYLCFIIDRLLAKYQRSQGFAKSSKSKVRLWYLASNLRKSPKSLLIKLRVPWLARRKKIWIYDN